VKNHIKGANLIQLISPTPPTIKQTKKGNKMASKNNIVISALADLWTKDILGLIKSGKHKEAISIGVKMGLKKKDILETIKEWK